MQQHNKTNKNANTIKKPGFSGTNPKKVKQEIQKDIRQGQGAMTSREAGSLRD